MLQLPKPILGEITAFTVATADLEESLEFYQMLGFSELMRADWPFPWIQVSDGVVLIMLKKDTQPYMALTYYVKDIDRVVKGLEQKGITFAVRPQPKEVVKRYLLKSPDELSISLVSMVDGFKQPTGVGMLGMQQEDYFKPEKYINKVCGLYGEFAHPVADIQQSIEFWKLLGFEVISEFTSPYAWAIMSDGLSVVGLHQTQHFNTPAITFFASDMRQKIARLKENGLTDYAEQGPGNIVITTPEDQKIFLFQLGIEETGSKPKLADIQQTVIETERLLLKEINPAILKRLYTSFSDEDIKRFLGFVSDEALDAERKRYDEGLSWYRATSQAFLIFDKETDKRIGMIGYHSWYKQHSRAEIGYDISDESLRGKGLMTEAMEAAIAYGFEQMELNRIEALIGSANVPSLKLVSRFGFTKEGVLRSHYCKNGKIEDSLCFSLLRSEYNPQ